MKKRFVSKLNWFVSLFRAKDIRYLVLLMAVLLLVDLLGLAVDGLFAYFKLKPCSALVWLRKFKEWFGYAFVHLFSPEKAAEKWLTMIVFFVGWLIGGGVLVTVMVGQFYKNKAGGFRRWTWLVENHIVVLGWDDGILAELAQAGSDGKHDCYVITKQSVPEMEQILKGAGIKNAYIYKGDYDNPAEWKDNLKIVEAVRVIIAGERDEPAHDARVRTLFDKVKAACGTPCKPRITVNIHDFGLARKLMEKEPETFENFHMNWADALWDRLGPEKARKPISLYVIGFGAMGKAVVISAMERFSPESIVVSDDDKDKLEEESERFKIQFATFKDQVTIVPEWVKTLKRFRHLPERETVIVVAKKRSEKSMLCMMDVISQLGSSIPNTIRLALNQEIDGYSVDSDMELTLDNCSVMVFGMKKGCKSSMCARAARCRNPDASALKAYAAQQGKALQYACGIAGAHHVLGGALGYDAALKGCYDIDLRLLIPDAGKKVEEVRRQIDSVKDLLAERAKGDPTFATKFIDESGTNYIWHTKQIVKVPAIPDNPDVALTWNIQAESSYQSLAEMASRLPKDVIDRYVVAKWNARQAGDASYRALKADWKSLLTALIKRGAEDMDERALSALLAEMRDSFPTSSK